MFSITRTVLVGGRLTIFLNDEAKTWLASADGVGQGKH